MIKIKEHNGKLRIGFNETFQFSTKNEAKIIMNKLIDYKEKYTAGIIAERVADNI
jgi:hypothetical protein